MGTKTSTSILTNETSSSSLSFSEGSGALDAGRLRRGWTPLARVNFKESPPKLPEDTVDTRLLIRSLARSTESLLDELLVRLGGARSVALRRAIS